MLHYRLAMEKLAGVFCLIFFHIVSQCDALLPFVERGEKNLFESPAKNVFVLPDCFIAHPSSWISADNWRR